MAILSEEQFAAALAALQARRAADIGWTGPDGGRVKLVRLGDEAGRVLIPPGERQHPAEAFFAYDTVAGDKQIYRLANTFAGLNYSNNDAHRAVWVGYPPGQSGGVLQIMGVDAENNAVVFGGVLPNQYQDYKLSLITPNRWQMLRLIPGGGMVIRCEGGWVYVNNQPVFIAPQEVGDVTAHVPATAGDGVVVLAVYTRELDWELVAGTDFLYTPGSDFTQYVPTAIPEGGVVCGGVLLYNGQSALTDDAILPYLPFFTFPASPVHFGATPTGLTIASGAVTITGSHHVIDTEAAAASDDLDVINGGLDNKVLLIRALDNARTVVVRHGMGNIYLTSQADYNLENTDQFLLLVYWGGAWHGLAVDAGGGGGGTFEDFTLAASSGTPATITDGQTVTLAGGTGINTAIAGNTVTVTLANTAVTPGAYTNPNITVDGQGRVTAIANGSAGTVTSVALSMPSMFSVAGSPVTTSGTFTVTLATQAVNRIFAGPASGGSAVPTFRTMVAGDIPLGVIDRARLANFTALSIWGRSSNSVGAAQEITSSANDQFLVRRSAALTWGTLVAADIPSHSASLITSGTLDNARINWAAPSAIGGTTPAAGTFSALTVSATAPEAIITGTAGNARAIYFRSGSSNRWVIFANATAESGSNAGSDFAIGRYTDAGGWNGTPFTIERSNGNASFSANVSVSGEVAIGGALNHDGSTVGFFGSTPATIGTVTGSLTDGSALANLLDILDDRYGLIINGT